MIRNFLLVDDDPDDVELFSEALQEVDKSIVFLGRRDCREVITQLRKGELRPEVIFLDINMPDMNGWDCLAALQGDGRLKDIPVVMYSTSSVSLDGKRAIENGAVGFLEKPPSYLELKEFLRKFTGTSMQTVKQGLQKIAESRAHRLLVTRS